MGETTLAARGKSCAWSSTGAGRVPSRRRLNNLPDIAAGASKSGRRIDNPPQIENLPHKNLTGALVLRASDLSCALRAARLRRNPNAGQIFLDFRYEDRLFWIFRPTGKTCQSLLSLLPPLNATASCSRTPFGDERCNVSMSAGTRWKV